MWTGLALRSRLPAAVRVVSGRHASTKTTLDAVAAAYPSIDRALLADRLIDGEAVAGRVLSRVSTRVRELKASHNITPGLAVVLVGGAGRAAAVLLLQSPAR